MLFIKKKQTVSLTKKYINDHFFLNAFRKEFQYYTHFIRRSGG